MSDNWYRNVTWNDDVAALFFEKLKRARRKEQYLRIQASTLASTHPQVALELLERYFALEDDFDHAQAYVDRATALRALGRTDEAVDSLECALSFEQTHPSVTTTAYLDLPYLVAVDAIETEYERALQLLNQSGERLMFPVDHFRWHAAHALIAESKGNASDAVEHAKAAIIASRTNHSGLPYHPELGLVGPQDSQLVDRLSRLANS